MMFAWDADVAGDDDNAEDDDVAGDDDVAVDDDTNNDIAGDDEASLLAASGLRWQYALTHWPPDPWHEHHPALHEGDQHDGYVGRVDDVGKLFANERRVGDI